MSRDVLDLFHPAVSAWFSSAFAAPTAAQVDAWPAIKAGRHALVAAPTGSGKTLAAFLAAEGTIERHPEESAGAARRHPHRARTARAVRRGDPHAGAHGRHAAGRA